MSTVTGEKAPIHGKGALMLEIGGLRIQHDVVVADIKDECILGTDFLTPSRCVVDLENHVLIINSEQIPLLRTKPTATLTCSKEEDSVMRSADMTAIIAYSSCYGIS